MQDPDAIVADAASAFAATEELPELEHVKARFLGKQGVVTNLLKELARLSPDERRTHGSRINQAKARIEELLAERRAALARAALDARLADEAIDVTLPGRGRGRGGIHPIIRTWQRTEAIFRSIGFDVADGPEIETDWYNFTALNQPENHPARSMHDTFYVEGGLAPAHAHEPDAGARCAHSSSADQSDRSGPHLPRGQRRDAFADVSPGRRSVDRRGHQLRRPERCVHRFPAAVLRSRRFAGALPALVLSVHRTVRRDRYGVQGRPLARDLRRRACLLAGAGC